MIGRVYRINVNENDFYIGSTIKKLFDRQAHHNIILRQNIRKNKLYEECREHNITEIICILLEELEIEDIKDIRKLEQEYITKLQPTLNHKGSYTGLTKKEYYEKNKSYIIEKNKSYKKEYREKNKEKKQLKNKEHYEKNKEALSKKRTEKINCPICNSIVSKGSIARHQKTIKCISYKTI